MSDYNFLMETRLTPEHFQVVSQISHAAGEQGLNLYLVGGAVRDLTYGQQAIHDLDFTVEGQPEKVIRHLLAADGGRSASPDPPAPLQAEQVHYSRRLNSAEIVFTNGVRAEIAMSRSETYARPGKAPEIAPGTIFEDLRRRDFSVNAMAVSLHPNSRGLLLDPTNGASDIEKRELRALHSRSLGENPLRIYRLLRLAARLGFKPEERTQAYLNTAIENRLWQRLDPEQQGNELRAILYEQDPARILKLLAAEGLLEGLDKKLLARQIPFDLFKKIRAVSPSVPGANPFLLNFDALVSKLGGGQRARLAKKIIGDSKTIRTALSLERDSRKLARVLGSARASTPSRAYKILVEQPPALLLFVIVHYSQTKIQNRIKNFLHKAPAVRASVPRADLLALGAKPGPKFERIIESLFFDQLDGKIKSHPQLIKEFRQLAGIPEPKPPKPAPEKPKAKAAKSAAPHEAPKSAAAAEPAKPAKQIEPMKHTAKPPAKPSAKPAPRKPAKKAAHKKPSPKHKPKRR